MSQSPCVVMVDLGPPAPERLEVVRRIKRVQPSAQIVVWTIYEWETYRVDAWTAGAAAYMVKEDTPDELLPVLTALLSEETRPDSDHRQINKEVGRRVVTGDI